MTGPDTERAAVTPPELHWVARTDEERRHAFRSIDGIAGMRSLCGRRWTSAWGHAGNGVCDDCAAVLRQVLAGRVTL